MHLKDLAITIQVGYRPQHHDNLLHKLYLPSPILASYFADTNNKINTLIDHALHYPNPPISSILSLFIDCSKAF